jgi:hypothetical protein
VFQVIATNFTKYSYAKLDSTVWVVRETSPWGWNNALYEPFLTPDPVPKSAFQSVTGTQYSYLGVDNPMLVLAYASFEGDTLSDPDFDHPLDRSSAPVLVKAETCIITPCERTYQLSMTAGQVQRVVLDTDHGVRSSDGPKVPTSMMGRTRWKVAGEQPHIGEGATLLSRNALQRIATPYLATQQ